MSCIARFQANYAFTDAKRSAKSLVALPFSFFPVSNGVVDDFQNQIEDRHHLVLVQYCDLPVNYSGACCKKYVMSYIAGSIQAAFFQISLLDSCRSRVLILARYLAKYVIAPSCTRNNKGRSLFVWDRSENGKLTRTMDPGRYSFNLQSGLDPVNEPTPHLLQAYPNHVRVLPGSSEQRIYRLT